MNFIVNRSEPPFPYGCAVTIGQRLQYALDLRRMTATSLIDALGVSKGTIYNILNDTTLATKVWGATARAICKELRISLDWFLAEEGPITPPVAAANDDDFSPIIGYAHGVALGDGTAPDEYAETHKLKFRADSLRKKGLQAENLAVYYGNGDSMQPTIEHDDAIMFNTADIEPRDDSIFILRSTDGIIAKRLRLFGDRWFVVSDNPHDPKWRNPVPLDDKRRGFHIVGRVRWIARWKD